MVNLLNVTLWLYVGLMHPEQQHAGWDIARNGMGWVGWMLCAYLRVVVEVRTSPQIPVHDSSEKLIHRNGVQVEVYGRCFRKRK